MHKIDEKISEIDGVISKNISKFDDSERGLLSQNILSQLRNLVEHVSLKAYANGADIENNYDNICAANAFVSARGNLKFLNKFYNLLQITASHYTLNEENSERLMLKYYEYLIKIKSFLKKTYGLDILNNIDEFPIKLDSALKEYYENIAEKINTPSQTKTKSDYNDRCYIQKIKPFFVKHEVYYEITFTIANDRASKFDRIIAFTSLDIPPNYAVKLSLSNDEIEVLGKKMPIQIIDKWEVSIRPCEFNNFADICDIHSKVQGGTIEYKEVMSFIKNTGLTLVEIVNLSDENYISFKESVIQKAKTTHIISILDKCRELIKNDSPGSNVLKFLMYRLNNKVIKRQYTRTPCEKLSNLYLKNGCIPFDEMPFNTFLIDHTHKLTDLFDFIDPTGREHELFARFITNNTEIYGKLYTHRDEIVGFQNIDDLIKSYNTKLYWTHGDRKLEDYKGYIYIHGYDQNTFKIISKLKELSQNGIKNYSSSVDAWIQSSALKIDCDEKKEKLKQMFEKSKVALIYGSAGTGKTTLINHISNFFNDKEKLYLANTNPAVDNLKRRVDSSNCTFQTVKSFLMGRENKTEFDILIIDECSTVSNADMVGILEKASYKLLILVGDTFQIESIRFGNWFSMAKDFVPTTSVSELTKPYRTHNTKLLDLWNKVRNIDEDILEHITKNDYSVRLDQSVFDHSESDEIILCLNYDGLYGINNINRFLQSNNKNKSFTWGVQTYKIGDPILFNESERFSPVIYNNLKGKIVNIEVFKESIQFDIEINKTLNGLEVEGYHFQLMDNAENGNSIIRFLVNKIQSTDEDDDSSAAIVPFQIAYAVSIHKAQGLEYESVKVVITDEVEEMITHNIFYTSITRAKDKLKIYWTPEAEKKVLESLKKKDSRKDVALLKAKFNL